MERQFNWPEQESLQLCDCVTSTGRRRKWTGGTEVRLANTSSKALRGEERDEKRGEESQEDAHRNENRWKEMTGGEKSLEELRCGFTICNKRSEVPEKSMEVCRSSYRQTLFLEPIALHFLNLETSATRLAGALLVYALYTIQWYLSIYIYLYPVIFIYLNLDKKVEPRRRTKQWNSKVEANLGITSIMNGTVWMGKHETHWNVHRRSACNRWVCWGDDTSHSSAAWQKHGGAGADGEWIRHLRTLKNHPREFPDSCGKLKNEHAL